jgi:plasmid segregation protein ParM
MSSNPSTRTVIAVDIGYGNTKMVCGHDLDKAGRAQWKEIVFPSIAPEVVVDEEASGFSNPDRIMISHNGRRYYTGPKATSGVVSRVIEPDYIETDLHELMLLTALHLAMRESKRVIRVIDKLVLGLPVSGHNSQRIRLKELGMKTRLVPVPKSLIHPGGPKEVEVHVRDCLILPQPYGAMRLAAQGLPVQDVIFQDGKLAMVVDPGYRTLDWFVSEAMTPDMKLSGSYDGGVSSILREVSQKIGFDHGTGSLEFDMVERGLQTGSINLGHKIIDMRDYIAMVPAIAGQEIGVFVTRLGGRRQNIARVFIAGGGAAYYEQAMRDRLPGCEITQLDRPILSNARGYWLAGCDALSD